MTFLFGEGNSQKSQLKGFLNRIKKQGAVDYRGFSKAEDFKRWLKTKAFKWKGWLPEV